MNNTNKKTTQSTESNAGNDPARVPPESRQIDPEAEQLRAENETLKRSLQMREARDAVVTALNSMGAESPDLLFAAVKDDLQFGADGEASNVAALVQNLKNKYPSQFGVRHPPASIDAGAGTSNPLNSISAESLARMTPAQIQKLDWAEVRRVLSDR